MNRYMQWEEKYELLKKYKEKYGNILVPVRYTIDGINLGFWLTNQRKKYNENTLEIYKIEKLNELGMDWNPNNTIWEEKYKLLKEYKEKYGNVDVPINYEVNKIKLGGWIREQRNAYKGIGTTKITKEQINKLNELGIKWNYHKETWDNNYELLKKYYEEYKNINIPLNYVTNGVNLGIWLATQRKSYKSKNKRLTEKQIEKLNELGMKWDLYKETWNEYYKLLKQYYKEHGNIDVPLRYQINGYKLGFWMNSQRTAYRGVGTHKITKSQIKKLNELGMKWNVYKETWDNNYKLLKEYKEKYGNIDIPQYFEFKGVCLGTWLNTQRMAYKGQSNYIITKEHIKLLNELDIDWAISETKKLNSIITNMEIYNISLLKRTDFILNDLLADGKNKIDSKDTQDEIKKILIKKIWR